MNGAITAITVSRSHSRTYVWGRRDVLWEHADNAPSKPLMADPAHSLLGDGDMATPRFVIAGQAFSKEQLGLCLNVLHFLQIGNDPCLVHNRVGGPHPAAEIKLEFSHRKRLGDQVEGRIRR